MLIIGLRGQFNAVREILRDSSTNATQRIILAGI
jgi:hypothetical protein